MPFELRARAYVGIGANLADPQAAVLRAIERLRPLGLVAASRLFRSAPVDAGGPDFINAVAELDTALDPLALLDALQQIESDFGRQRPYLHAPRTLDLDLLLHGDSVITNTRLTLPHPRLHRRAFVLKPLLELAPQLSAPGLGLLARHLANTGGQVVEPLVGPPTMPR